MRLLFPPCFEDARGTFRPVFASRLYELTSHPWAEMNITETAPGCIRGLHLRLGHLSTPLKESEKF